jgi:hypothetical protein
LELANPTDPDSVSDVTGGPERKLP